MPPTPKAKSSEIEPVGIASTFKALVSESFIILPSPNFSFIWSNALSMAFHLPDSAGAAFACFVINLLLLLMIYKWYTIVHPLSNCILWITKDYFEYYQIGQKMEYCSEPGLL